MAWRSRCCAVAGQSGYLERLECYDKLAKSLEMQASSQTKAALADGAAVAIQPVAQQHRKGNWQIEELGDRVQFHLQSGGTSQLALTCQTGQPGQLAIDWDADLDSDVYITMGMDKAKKQRLRWHTQPNGNVTVHPQPLAQLLPSLLAGQQLEAFAYGGDRVLQARFDLSQLDEALSAYHAQCGLQ